MVRDGAALLLRRGQVLVRVRPALGRAVAGREVRLAGVLTDAGVPVTRLVPAVDQPWTVGTCVVTAWLWCDGADVITADALGRLARTLRERTADVAGDVAEVLDPIEAVLGAVAHLPAHDSEARFVRERAAELAEGWVSAAATDPLGRAVVHGDLHPGNVVAGPDGPLLTDLELTGIGPPGYDAAPAVVAVQRYGAHPSELDAFLASFGSDPRSWAGFATFVDLYELWVTAWAVGVRHQDPAWAVEASRRVGSLRDGAGHQWNLS